MFQSRIWQQATAILNEKGYVSVLGAVDVKTYEQIPFKLKKMDYKFHIIMHCW